MGLRHVVVAVVFAALAGCAATPSSAPGENGTVVATAPRLADFAFIGPAFASAEDFQRWRAMSGRARAGDTAPYACLAEKASCVTADLVRFRRMLEVGRGLPPAQQLNLVQAYFNAVAWTSEDRDSWLPLFDVAAYRHGDCEDIALAKYATLRRWGWEPSHLRVVVGWDNEEKDWHAWLVVNIDNAMKVLDSIKGVQGLRHFRGARAVYSISELGVWDHAPDFVPVSGDVIPERAARLAALEHSDRKGNPE